MSIHRPMPIEYKVKWLVKAKGIMSKQTYADTIKQLLSDPETSELTNKELKLNNLDINNYAT